MIKTNNFTANENIDLMNEISLIHPLDTPLTTYLLANNLYDMTGSTLPTWREKSLDTTNDITVAEGSNASNFANSTRAEKHNATEIFMKSVKVSGTAMSSSITGIPDLLNEEAQDRLAEMKVNIERKLINGTFSDGSVDGKRQMKGLLNFVTAGNKVNRVFNEKNFKETVKKLWDSGLATGQYIAMCNADLKEELDEIYKDKYFYQAPQTNEFGLVVNQVMTNYGNVDVLLNRHMPEGQMLIFDPSFLRITFMQNRTPHMELLGKQGDYIQAMLLAELSLKVLNEKAVSLFTLTTGA